MKILRGTVFGGITYFFLGWLIWGILLMGYMSANMNQCAARPDNEMIWWAIILSNLAAAMLLTFVLKWAKAASLVDGLKYGAVFGILFGVTLDFSFWSMTTMFNNIGALLVDILASTFAFAIVGLIIVFTWGKD